MRPKNQTTLLKEKVKRGEPLSPEEREVLRAYFARYYRRKQGIHLKGPREQKWRESAQQTGLSLSAWIQVQVEKALAGPSARERELMEENQRLRDENTGLRGSNGHFSVENSRLHQRVEAIEGNLIEATAHALRLAKVASP